MRTEVEEVLLVSRGVRDHLAVNEFKPELGPIAKPVEELVASIERLTAAGVSQERSDRACRSMTSVVRARAANLREVYLKPASRMWKRLVKSDPTLVTAMAMPSRRGYERLIVTANAMADEAAAHRAAFVAAGFAETFPEQLKQATDLLRQAIDARRSHLGHRSAATLGMIQEAATARDLVRLLDALVMPWLKAHAPDQVGQWKTLTRFERPTPAEKVDGGVGSEPAGPEVHAA